MEHTVMTTRYDEANVIDKFSSVLEWYWLNVKSVLLNL